VVAEVELRLAIHPEPRLDGLSFLEIRFVGPPFLQSLLFYDEVILCAAALCAMTVSVNSHLSLLSDATLRLGQTLLQKRQVDVLLRVLEPAPRPNISHLNSSTWIALTAMTPKFLDVLALHSPENWHKRVWSAELLKPVPSTRIKLRMIRYSFLLRPNHHRTSQTQKC